MINNERLLTTFLDYIQIPSESTHEGAFARRLAEDLRAIGCQVTFDDSQEETGSDTGNLYATLPGNTAGEALIFSAHMDTVTPGIGIEPVIENGMVRSKGDTILGGDDKSGIAAVVEAMRRLTEECLPHPTIQAVFTVCEENGLRGSSAIDVNRLAGKRAIVLDSGGDAGTIITSAPGQYKVNAVITGRRAHAGVAPEGGISAIQVAAEAISAMKLLRIDEETTANVGSFVSEYATNIVPEKAEICAEARSRNDEKLAAQVGHMVRCFRNACEKHGAALDCIPVKAYSAYSYADADPFVQEVSAACRKLGLTAKTAASGGGSDANHFNAFGLQALNLGTGMTKVHTTDEEISIKNLEDIAALVLALMQQSEC